MSSGLGAGFFGLTLITVLLGLAGLLVGTTIVAFYGRHKESPTGIMYAAAGLVGVVVIVAGFGVILLADEASFLAVLLGAIVGLPLLLIAVRARWAGANGLTLAAISGMAWSLPFIVSVGLLLILQVHTDVSPTVMTGLTGIVTSGGALLIGEGLGSSLSVDYSSIVRA